MKEPLTASRMGTLMSCPRKHYYAYELGIRPEATSDALGFGTAWHEGMEARWHGAELQGVLDAAVTALGTNAAPERRAVLIALLTAYCEVYKDDPLRTDYAVVPEQEFSHTLASRTFEARGKIDGIAQNKTTGEVVLIEHKTCGESVEPTAKYWERLTYNTQVLQYVSAARAKNLDVNRVIYDVARKPLLKIKNGETFEAYAERLTADILSRPDFYFARREVMILDDDLFEFEEMREQIAKEIVYFRAAARKFETAKRPAQCGWPRNVSALHCNGCEYSGLCLSRLTVDAAHVPSGFIVQGATPELKSPSGGYAITQRATSKTAS